MDLDSLYRFFEGQTSDEENGLIRTWLKESPENEKQFREERRLHDALIISNKYRKNNPVEEAKNRFEIRKKKRSLSVFIRETLKISAAVLLTVLTCWYYFSQIENRPSPVAMQEVRVPPGQRINLLLPDGTNVWLNAKTTIKYPVDFNKKERLVFIDGQAYFEVAKNKEKPFIVKSPHGMVEALGTKFDVLDYSGKYEDFQTMLMEGSVRVRLHTRNNESVTLSPNKKTCMAGGKLDVEEEYDHSAYEWRNGLISFRSATFSDIMRTFEKTYDVAIVVENKNIEKQSFTGKFRVVDGIEYALNVLQRDAGFKYESTSDRGTIYIR